MLKKLFYLPILFVSTSAAASSLLDSDLSTKSNDNDVLSINNQSKLNKFIDKNISGSIGASYVTSDSAERNSAFLQLRLDNDNKYSRIVIDGQYIDSSIELTQTDSSGDERTIEYSFSDPELLETYVDLKLLKNLTLSAGLKKIVWGQFEPFSPVDFALPMYFSRNFTDYNKYKGRVPKENLSLIFFPHPKIEISAYYFTEYEVDPIIEKINSDDDVTIPSGSDAEQEAIRVMFYPEFGTFGFTYFNGFGHFENNQGNYYDSTSNSVLNNPSLVDNEMFGFEFAKQFDKFNLKFEYTISDTVTSLQTVQSSTSYTDYFSWVTGTNDNKFYVEGDLHFAALGFDFDKGLWNYNLIIYYYEIMYSGDDQTGVDYDEDLFSDDDDGPTGYGNFLPSFSVARYLTEEKNSQIGLVAGILGVGQGAALFATGTINESFEWVASIELVEYFSDMLIDDANDDSNYESDDEFVGAVRASIQYSF